MIAAREVALRSVVALVAATVSGCGGCREEGGPARGSGENLLWITLCGVRADVLDECVDDGGAPTLAALKSRATIATTVDATSLRCDATLAETRRLALVLAAAGYGTAAFVSRSELAPDPDLPPPFARFSLPPIERFTSALSGPEAAPLRLRRSAAATSEEAGGWLAHEATPFFLWVQWNGLAVEEAVDLPPTRADARARLAAIDRALAPLLAALAVAGRDARTVIVVAADHGEELGEPRDGKAGGFGHRRPVESVTKTPLWIVEPRSRGAALAPRSLRELAPVLAARLAPATPFVLDASAGVSAVDGAQGPESPPLPWFVERGLVPLSEAAARALLPELRRFREATKRQDPKAPELPEVIELKAAALLALPKRDDSEEQELRELAPLLAAAASADHPFAATLHAKGRLAAVAPKGSDERLRAAKAAVAGAPWYFPAVQELTVQLQLRVDNAGALDVLERFGKVAPLAPAARAEFEKGLAQTRAHLAPTPRVPPRGN